MGYEPRGTVLTYLKQVLATADEASDGQLLERYRHGSDPAAFADLVRRHGPMVLGVCRRILHDAADADDAFQATFLVLLRKAAAIGRGEAVGSWLYKVAYRTALRARHTAARRRAREAPAVVSVEPATADPDPTWRDLRPVLDQELARLPEVYRRPVVLCYLEGKTKEQAARQLGWPTGTVSGRLARAKDLLRHRLTRRGLALPAAALAALLTERAAVAVPAALLERTQSLVTGTAAPAAAAALSHGVMRTMFWHQLKPLALVFLAAVLLGGTGGPQPPAGGGDAAGAAEKPAPAAQAQPAPAKPATPAKPAAPEKKAPRVTTLRELHQRLRAPVEGLAQGIPEGTTLQEALNQLTDLTGVPIRIDQAAFRAALQNDPNAGRQLAETPAHLAPPKPGTPLAAALDELLTGLPEAATYLVKGAQIVVVPLEPYKVTDVEREPSQVGLSVSPLLRERVRVNVEEQPLAAALKELAEAAGANIIIDVRLRDKAKTPVSACLQHVPLETAVRLLCDMADVKAVPLDNVLYITTAENAEKLLREEYARNGLGPNGQPNIPGIGAGAMGGLGGGAGVMGGFAGPAAGAGGEAPPAKK
jgi:RNA polymerase sigma factor (sigma-70 family)